MSHKFFVVLPFILSGCLAVDDFTREKIEARRAAAEQTLEMTKSLDKTQIFLANTTTKVWNVHGTQIEYLSPDGSTYLWYPGNAAVLPGRWKLQKQYYGSEICFLYGSYTYNPVTRQTGGNWECDIAAYYLLDRDEIVDGDPLKLSKRIPYVLPANKNISIAEAMKNAGNRFTPARNKAMAPQYPRNQQ
ncbi:MAG: hypothetical protein QM744_03815 [Mesorhizobium sp.]